MNLMLVGGFPSTVTPVAERKAYLTALSTAIFGGNIEPFRDFLAKAVGTRLAGGPLPAVPEASSWGTVNWR
jgi:hypothetical protein